MSCKGLKGPCGPYANGRQCSAPEEIRTIERCGGCHIWVETLTPHQRQNAILDADGNIAGFKV